MIVVIEIITNYDVFSDCLLYTSRVHDDNGNEYKVGRSGEYVQDKNGDWKRVSRDGNNDPYIVSDNDKIWLK